MFVVIVIVVYPPRSNRTAQAPDSRVFFWVSSLEQFKICSLSAFGQLSVGILLDSR